MKLTNEELDELSHMSDTDQQLDYLSARYPKEQFYKEGDVVLMGNVELPPPSQAKKALQQQQHENAQKAKEAVEEAAWTGIPATAGFYLAGPWGSSAGAGIGESAYQYTRKNQSLPESLKEGAKAAIIDRLFGWALPKLFNRPTKLDIPENLVKEGYSTGGQRPLVMSADYPQPTGPAPVGHNQTTIPPRDFNPIRRENGIQLADYGPIRTQNEPMRLPWDKEADIVMDALGNPQGSATKTIDLVNNYIKGLIPNKLTPYLGLQRHELNIALQKEWQNQFERDIFPSIQQMQERQVVLQPRVKEFMEQKLANVEDQYKKLVEALMASKKNTSVDNIPQLEHDIEIYMARVKAARDARALLTATTKPQTGLIATTIARPFKDAAQMGRMFPAEHLQNSLGVGGATAASVPFDPMAKTKTTIDTSSALLKKLRGGK